MTTDRSGGGVGADVAVDDQHVGVEAGAETALAVAHAAGPRRARRRRDQGVGDGRTAGHEVEDGLGEDAVALALRDAGVVTRDDLHPCREDGGEERLAALEGHAEAGEHLLDPRRQHGVGGPAERRADDDLPLAEPAHQVLGELDAVLASGTCSARCRRHRPRRPARPRPAAWAWAVTGRPRPWDSSTTQRSSSRVNWQAAMSVPGVMFPPLAITFTMSTRRSARSRTAARSAVLAGHLAAHHPAVPADRGDGRTGGDDVRLVVRARAVAAIHDGPPVVAQVPDRRHARGQLLGQRRVDHRLQVVGRELRQPLQGAVLRVTAQVDVRVDEPRQHGAVGDVDELDAVRHRSAGGLDAGDPAVLDEDHRAVRPQLLAVEGPGRPDRQHGDGVPHRASGLVSRRSRPTTTGPRPARRDGPGRPRSPPGSGPGAAARTDPTTAPPGARGRPTR